MANDPLKRRDPTYVQLSQKWFRRAQVFPDDRDHLLRSLHGLESEMAPTPSFPLYGTTEAKVIIKRFLDTVVLPDKDVPDWMKEYELSRLEKVGPQGGHKSWEELKPLFDLYQERYVDEIHIPKSTLDYLDAKYGSLHCAELSNAESLNTLKSDKRIETRAAGCRRFALKKTDPEAQRYALLDLKSGLCDRFFGYTFSRYNKLKLRLFMPMPFSDMIREAKWYSPLMHAIQEDLREHGASSKFTFWADKLGFDKCFAIMQDEINSVRDSTYSIPVFVQRDFEKMDTTTGPAQQRLFCRVIGKAFDLHGQSYRRMEESLLFAVECPIATPSGMMVGDHGMASGATTTNGSETVNNDAFDYTATQEVKRKCKQEGIRVILASTKGNGDDGSSVWLLASVSDLERFKEILAEAYAYAAKVHGFISQTSKWKVSTQFGLYCQNFFWLEGAQLRWAYPATLILNSIMNPEHHYTAKQWDRDFRDLDILQKLDNGRGLPYFEQLVKFVDNGMKYRLLGDKRDDTVSRIFSKYEKYRALQPLAERYNREDWSTTTSPSANLLLGRS